MIKSIPLLLLLASPASARDSLAGLRCNPLNTDLSEEMAQRCVQNNLKLKESVRRAQEKREQIEHSRTERFKSQFPQCRINPVDCGLK